MVAFLCSACHHTEGDQQSQKVGPINNLHITANGQSMYIFLIICILGVTWPKCKGCWTIYYGPLMPNAFDYMPNKLHSSLSLFPFCAVPVCFCLSSRLLFPHTYISLAYLSFWEYAKGIVCVCLSLSLSPSLFLCVCVWERERVVGPLLILTAGRLDNFYTHHTTPWLLSLNSDHSIYVDHHICVAVHYAPNTFYYMTNKLHSSIHGDWIMSLSKYPDYLHCDADYPHGRDQDMTSP